MHSPSQVVQSACQSVDASSAEESLASIVADVHQEALAGMTGSAQPSEPSTPEPSHAEVNSGKYAMAITTALVAVAAL